MKNSVLLFVLAGTFIFSGIAHAQGTPAPVVSAPPVGSSSWLASQGVLSVEDLSKLIGTTFSPADRERLEKAVAARNTAIIEANARLSSQLTNILRVDDSQIANRVEKTANDSKEAERMDRMRRLQPSRYQEMMHRKKEAEKDAAPGEVPK